jgi:hypothetical protein
MALYKDDKFVKRAEDAVFDEFQHPGEDAARSGIYRCSVCGIEVVSTQGNPLPPLNHLNHAPASPHGLWRLTVFANHNPA